MREKTVKSVCGIVCIMVLALAMSVPALCQYPYVISTVAGSYPLGDNGPATAALLLEPRAAVMDSAGNLYIADSGNRRVRKVSPAGVTATLAGFENALASSLAVDASGNVYIGAYCRVWKLPLGGKLIQIAGTGTCGHAGDGGAATQARIGNVRGVAVDSQGNLYLADVDSDRVRKVDSSGVITTFAGTASSGYSGDNGPAIAARLNGPNGLAADEAGNVYIADTGNHRIRKVATSGVITTLAGTGAAGAAGDGGPADAARLSSPGGLAVDRQGNLYIADAGNHRIRRVSSVGAISTVAGTGTAGYSGDGGLATAAMLFGPEGVSVDQDGNLYVAEETNGRVRKISIGGVITTVAGASHFGGDGGPATSALLKYPLDVAVDSAGNLYIADGFNFRVRKVDASGTIRTLAGNGTYGYTGDGGQATAAALRYPRGIVTDPAGNVYFSTEHAVRKVTPAGIISTLAGRDAAGYAGDGGLATGAQLRTARGLVIDGAGNLFIADDQNHRVRKVAPDGTISTCAGTGTAGFSGDGGQARLAQLNAPHSVGLDSAGNLYIADYNNLRVRKVSPAGIITTVAGNGTSGAAGDGGPATAAQLGTPRGVAVDASGNLYFTEADRIRKVSPAGIINIIAGGSFGFSGDGGLAASAKFWQPSGIAVDRSGVVYIADRNNCRIRKLTPNPPAQLAIVSGNNQSGPVGTALPGALRVQVTFSAGVAVPGVYVSFSVTSGSATLSADFAATDANGQAGVGVTLGNTVGAVTVTASISGLTPVRFTLTATEAAGPVAVGPRISAGGIAGAGGSIPPIKQISPNGLVSLYGENFAFAGTVRAFGAADLVDGRVPTKLAGVCVKVGTLLAPVLLVSPNQLNIQAPSLTGSGDVAVQVMLNCGETGEVKSNADTVTLQAATPEFLYFIRNTDGKNPIAAIDALTGALIGAPGLLAGANFTPAKPGNILTLFATGFGLTNPAFQAGELPDRIAPTVGKVKLVIGTVEVADADLLYAGVTPTYAGLYQVNLRIPANVPDGDLPVVVRVGEFSSPPGPYLTVRK